MAKKKFLKGLNALMGDVNEDSINNIELNEFSEQNDFSKTSTLIQVAKVAEKSTESRPQRAGDQGLKPGESRVTFILNQELYDQLRSLAYWERLPIKYLMNTILVEYLSKVDPKELSKAIKAFEAAKDL